jgi:hypothetical protein
MVIWWNRSLIYLSYPIYPAIRNLMQLNSSNIVWIWPFSGLRAGMLHTLFGYASWIASTSPGIFEYRC